MGRRFGSVRGFVRGCVFANRVMRESRGQWAEVDASEPRAPFLTSNCVCRGVWCMEWCVVCGCQETREEAEEEGLASDARDRDESRFSRDADDEQNMCVARAVCESVEK